ncbi:hypothetical protein ACPA9J_34895 [Pseudomonas aeruginosa]
MNHLVARPDNKDSDALKKLSAALTSPEVESLHREEIGRRGGPGLLDPQPVPDSHAGRRCSVPCSRRCRMVCTGVSFSATAPARARLRPSSRRRRWRRPVPPRSYP